MDKEVGFKKALFVDAEANGDETAPALNPTSSPAYDHCLDNLNLGDPGKRPLFEEYVEMSKSSYSKPTPLRLNLFSMGKLELNLSYMFL